MSNWKLTIEYDGSEFSGWQIQPNARTVQEEIEHGLTRITGSPTRIAGGGRTDAGVHASGQVASVELEKEFRPEVLRRSLNGVLPYDVVILNAETVPADFHARFSARSRRYRYAIVQRPNAIGRQYAWTCHYEMDAGILRECASRVMGEQDFTSFAKADAETEHGICRVTEASWQTMDHRLEFTITANRFLYGMVRALVGTMVDVARGYRKIEEWKTICDARDRSAAGAAAPAQGLCLMSISYVD
jgi:tRNA pseudouridine38-40 synthase